ncbi:hypothetical protein KQI84_02635 [bacterium]|nr:hypothetical protein [bacterium]
MKSRKNLLQALVTAGAAGLLSSLLVSAAPAQPLADIELLAVSPRDIAAAPDDEFTEVYSGLPIVGIGQLVYLEADPASGATISGYEWALTPSMVGSSAALSSNTGDMVTFRPDMRGDFTVTLTPLDGSANPTESVNVLIRAGEWMGAGVFNTWEPPAPYPPNCGTSCCHDDNANDRLNKLGDWITSGHAVKFQRDLNGETTNHYSESCLECHTVGFNLNPAAVNNGFDDIADMLSYPLSNIPDLVNDAYNNNDPHWADLPAELQGHGSIQCENCHGPGSQHLGNIREDDSGIAGVDFGLGQCAQCHDSASGHQQGFYQWGTSAHMISAEAAGGHAGETGSCTACHTAEGFKNIQVDGDAPVDLHGALGVTCTGCHDPHNSDNPHQLRLAGDFDLPSGDTFEDPGLGGLCGRCHNSRVEDVDATALGSFRGAHHGPQADMLLGKNAADFGLDFVGNSAHTTIVEDTCVACHMADGVGSGLTPPLVGEHTYSMRDTNGTADEGDDTLNVVNACGECHSELATTYDREARGDYDGDGTVEGIQSEVEGLLEIIADGLLNDPTHGSKFSLGSDGTIGISQGDFATLPDGLKYARYNYNYVVDDGSRGIHNTSYAVQSLQRAYFGIFNRPITDDYPEMDLRGPVQPTTLPPTPTPTPSPTPTATPTPAPESLAHIVIEGVSPRDLALDQSGNYTEASSGLDTVGIGNLIYMHAVEAGGTVHRAITGYTWSIAEAPADSVATLTEIDNTFVTFRPDKKGTYKIHLEIHTDVREGLSETLYEQVIYAANWQGAGVFEDDGAHLPECATGFCHGDSAGQDRLKVASDWVQSNHAQKLQKHLNGEYGSHYDVSCLECHSVGFDQNPLADNNGFDDIAEDIKFDLNQIPQMVHDAVTSGIPQFDNLPEELKSHASIQCENCHGPGEIHPYVLRAGNEKGVDGVNLNVEQCARCHDSNNGYQQLVWQWENSGHSAATPGHASTGSGCIKCHSGDGFVDVQVKGLPANPIDNPIGQTCSTCHDPHFSDIPHQLRLEGDLELPNGTDTYGVGLGGLCMRCHNSRRGDADDVYPTESHGPHRGPQGEVLIGTSAVSFGLDWAPSSPHYVAVEDTCVACHMAPPSESGPGVTTPPLVGSHTFSLRDTMGTEDLSDDVTNHENACKRCHLDIQSLDYPSHGDYDGNGLVEGTQTEVRGLMLILRDEFIADVPGTTYDEEYGPLHAPDFNALTDTQKAVLWNYNLAAQDGSFGVHNTSFTVQSLQRAYYPLTGNVITNDFPSMDLRGPVQDGFGGVITETWLVR